MSEGESPTHCGWELNGGTLHLNMHMSRAMHDLSAPSSESCRGAEVRQELGLGSLIAGTGTSNAQSLQYLRELLHSSSAVHRKSGCRMPRDSVK